MKNKHGYVPADVGIRIRKARKHLKKTQEEIAGGADITGQYWSLIENGRYNGCISTYLQIANALGLTLNDLFYSEADLLRRSKQLSTDGFFADCDEYEKIVLVNSLFSMKKIMQKERTIRSL